MVLLLGLLRRGHRQGGRGGQGGRLPGERLLGRSSCCQRSGTRGSAGKASPGGGRLMSFLSGRSEGAGGECGPTATPAGAAPPPRHGRQPPPTPAGAGPRVLDTVLIADDAPSTRQGLVGVARGHLGPGLRGRRGRRQYSYIRGRSLSARCGRPRRVHPWRGRPRRRPRHPGGVAPHPGTGLLGRLRPRLGGADAAQRRSWLPVERGRPPLTSWTACAAAPRAPPRRQKACRTT